MAFQPGSVFLYGAGSAAPRPTDELHWSAGCSSALATPPAPTSRSSPAAAPPLDSQQMMAAVMAAEQQVSLEQQLAASILMHRQRLLQQHTQLAEGLARATPQDPMQVCLEEEDEEAEHEEDEEHVEDEDEHNEEASKHNHNNPPPELLSHRHQEPFEQPEAEQEQALNLSIHTAPSRQQPLATTTQSSHIQASISRHHSRQLNDQSAPHLRPLETQLDHTRHLLFQTGAAAPHHHNHQLNGAHHQQAAASLTSHLSNPAGHHNHHLNHHLNPLGQLAASLVSSTSSAASSSSSASSSSGWSSAADSLASCSPDRAPATRSPANHHHTNQLHQNRHQQSPNNNNNTNNKNQQQQQQKQQQQHPHKPLFLHHLHLHHHELGPVHKTDSDDLDRIRNFIELFKARRGALGLTQKQAAQCFRAYTNDRYAFSDNFVGHFEGFQFRPQTAMTIADSLADWLEYAENETRQGRQLNFMPGRVKETRKRKYEVIRIRDSAKRVLVEAFEKNKSPSTSELEQLSRKTNIPSRNIEIFFKNRRTSRQYHQ